MGLLSKVFEELHFFAKKEKVNKVESLSSIPQVQVYQSPIVAECTIFTEILEQHSY